MTYHAPDIDSSGDRPALEGDAEASPDVVVTDEMIAAGISALSLCEQSDPAEWTVVDIYRAMRPLDPA